MGGLNTSEGRRSRYFKPFVFGFSLELSSSETSGISRTLVSRIYNIKITIDHNSLKFKQFSAL